jgi:wyosine [tRNA(Phe)-imidazoG37] synthetase (radical SAM superfamily)
MTEHYRHLFGPVPSRRLGRSLGVDLVPLKTCTMDCIYCQLGNTACTVSERDHYVPMHDVLAELDRWLKQDGQADHITLAGSGEPTLHICFGDLFRWTKENTQIASALLTNGSLLHLPEVRAEAALADKVKVTLSAWDEESFRRIHRPARGITFEKLLAGERAFRREYAGELSVEVFIVEGINSDMESARRIAAMVESIDPDRIEINTAVRPPADPNVKASSPEQLQALAGLFGPKAAVTMPHGKSDPAGKAVTSEKLLGIIRRHPATAQQLANEFNAPVEAVSACLDALIGKKHLSVEERDGVMYYFHRAAE